MLTAAVLMIGIGCFGFGFCLGYIADPEKEMYDK